MNRALVVVDYQKDFVDGALGFPKAVELEQGIAALVERYLAAGDRVCFTLDTHQTDYLQTREGTALPVPHCIEGSAGWLPYGELAEYVSHPEVQMIKKTTFGSVDYADFCASPPDEITLVGVVTNMCVISNAVTLQALFPNAQIVIESSLCASFDDVLHQKALDVMAGLQMLVR